MCQHSLCPVSMLCHAQRRSHLVVRPESHQGAGWPVSLLCWQTCRCPQLRTHGRVSEMGYKHFSRCLELSPGTALGHLDGATESWGSNRGTRSSQGLLASLGQWGVPGGHRFMAPGTTVYIFGSLICRKACSPGPIALPDLVLAQTAQTEPCRKLRVERGSEPPGPV